MLSRLAAAVVTGFLIITAVRCNMSVLLSHLQEARSARMQFRDLRVWRFFGEMAMIEGRPCLTDAPVKGEQVVLLPTQRTGVCRVRPPVRDQWRAACAGIVVAARGVLRAMGAGVDAFSTCPCRDRKIDYGNFDRCPRINASGYRL